MSQDPFAHIRAVINGSEVMRVQYGYNESSALVIFPKPLQNLVMDRRQLDEMIAALSTLKEKLDGHGK